MLLVCIVPIIVAWSDGQEFVRKEAVKARAISKAGSQMLVELDKAEMGAKGAVKHNLNRVRRWIFEEQCYKVPKGTTY